MTGTLIVPRGLPASGKTSWARFWLSEQPVGSAVRLNRDDLRAMALPDSYSHPTHDVEQVVSLIEHTPIAALLRAGVDVIVDDTNLRVKFVRDLDRIAASVGAETRVVDDFLDVPVDECVRRDLRRERSVGEHVIRGMHDRYLSGGRRLPAIVRAEAVTGKPYTPVPGMPTAIVVDIDGTVALHEGVRSPYDPTRYHLDRPNLPVIEQVRMAAERHYILFTSGRDIEHRVATVEWLGEHVLTDDVVWDLFMRPAGDTRNDAVVKLELFDQHIRDRFDVRWVYDDRDRVVAMWRSLGLAVMQVAPGDF
jgi:predicted kinase